MKKKQIALLSVILFLLTVGYKTESVNVVIPKIYLSDSLLLKVDSGSKIKIYNTANPSNPVHLSDININGNADIAVNDVYVYADSYKDLIIYNIYNPSNPKTVDTIKNIFQKSYMVNDFLYNDYTGGTSGCNCSDGESSPVSAQNYNSRGTGGSLSRFAITKNHLYSVDLSDLYIFDLSTPSYPTFRAKINVGWDIETIFPYKDYLFIGGMNGMYIYTLTNPSSPVQVSQFTHARACDPVVVENNLAYITLRNGTACGPSENALHIVDVSNTAQPKLLQTFLMDEPYGLAVKNRIVYVCDGIGGIKVVSTVDHSNIKFLKVLGNTRPYDCIISSNILYVTAQDGILIYNISNPSSPVLLSTMR